jgi:hypothetical protein
VEQPLPSAGAAAGHAPELPLELPPEPDPEEELTTRPELEPEPEPELEPEPEPDPELEPEPELEPVPMLPSPASAPWSPVGAVLPPHAMNPQTSATLTAIPVDGKPLTRIGMHVHGRARAVP